MCRSPRKIGVDGFCGNMYGYYFFLFYGTSKVKNRLLQMFGLLAQYVSNVYRNKIGSCDAHGILFIFSL